MAELDTKMPFAKLQSCENIWRPFQSLEWGMLVGKSNVCGFFSAQVVAKERSLWTQRHS